MCPQGIQRKQETETTRASLELLYHISRELTSAFDLRTVLQRVLFLSMRTVGAISGSIIVLDDNQRPVESAIITGEMVHNDTTQRLRATLDRGLAGWVVRNKQAALVEDTSRDERWITRQYEVEVRTGSRSAVSAPLLGREKLVGVITLVNTTPGFFTNEHLALVQAIADQAGVAVLNARLYAESQRQARVMTALAESAAAITASLNLEAVLHRIMEQISQALRVQAVSLALVDSEKNELEFRAAIGWKNVLDPKPRLRLGQGIAGIVAREGRGMVVVEARQDTRFDPEIERRVGFETRAIACAPIRHHGHLIGILEAINPTSGDFDPDAILVLTGIGSLAGTAIRHAQLFESLQSAHQSFRELFEDSIDPILITDRQGRVMEANRQAEKITGYDGDALQLLSIRQLHAPDEDQLGRLFESLANGATLSYESLLRTRSQHEIPIQVYVRQIQTDVASRIQWILRDVTERKKLDTMREDLISMIYHDLRSPLANIVSSLDVLDNVLMAQDDAGLRPLLHIALRSTERIQRLTNSLLDINRLEAGQPVGERGPAQPDDLAQEAVEIVLPVAETKQQSLTSHVSHKLPTVLVESDMIRRVLTNLLENAVKYSPFGGQIEVGAQLSGDWVEFCVQDNGPGIPASEHERIFDKFTRLNAADSPKGLGLGLAYCRMAVNSHGGHIWVESDPGHGAKFFFTLPVAVG